MKVRFGVKEILLVTALVAITVATLDLYWRIALRRSKFPKWIALTDYAYGAPLFVPVAFVAFAVGRKKLTPLMVVLFAVTQGLVFAVWGTWRGW